MMSKQLFSECYNLKMQASALAHRAGQMSKGTNLEDSELQKLEDELWKTIQQFSTVRTAFRQSQAEWQEENE